MEYDVIIPLAEKDFNKFKYAYDSIGKYLPKFKNFYCVSPVPIPEKLRISDVRYYLDDDVLDFDFSVFTGKIKIRTGWYRQQFIELFQKITGDNYLVSDSDNIYTKKIELFRNGKPIFIMGEDQNHPPYFKLSQKLFGFGREYPYSFINEIMLFKRHIIKELVDSTGFSEEGFFVYVASELNRTQENSGMAQYELYGNYVTKFHHGSYHYEYLSFLNVNKHRKWTDSEINECIKQAKKKDITMIKIHSWM